MPQDPAKNQTINEEAGLPDNWVPVDAAPVNPGVHNPSGILPPASGKDPYNSGALPPNFGLQPRLVKTAYGGPVAEIDLMPIQGGAGDNAKSAGVAQTIVDRAIANIPVSSSTVTAGNGIQVNNNVVALLNPIVDGDPIWQIDPGVANWRDDFYFSNNTVTPVGEQRWTLVAAASAIVNSVTGTSPHWGMLRIDSGTSNGPNCSAICPPQGNTFSGSNVATGVFAVGMPLLDYAGWKMVWVFGFPPGRAPSSVSTFPLTKSQFYCGLAVSASVSGVGDTWAPNNTNARPPFFVGLRYDTDPGSSGNLAVSSVGSGNGIYTGTFPNGGSNAYVGYYITMSGFANAANNGTFLITASTTTTITTNNSGSVSTSAGTANIPSIGDSTFKFEVVSNPNLTSSKRNNTAGTVFDTTLIPKENQFYRFELICTVAGQVTMNLICDDGTSASNTFTSIPVATVGPSNTVGGFSLAVQNGMMQMTASTAFPFDAAGSISGNMAWSPGSKVTITGATNAYFDKTWVIGGDQLDSHWNVYTGDATNLSEVNSPATQTGFPGLMPYFGWGNDFQTTPASKIIGLDFWGFAINAGLAGATPNSALSRYY